MTTPPNDLPPASVESFLSLTDDQKALFASTFNRRKRNMVLMIILSVLFPIQLFFLRRVGLGVIFILTGGGFGIWYVIEWFLTPGRVQQYNARVAAETLSTLTG